MDDRAFRNGATRRAAARWVVVLAASAAGCSTYVGTTARSFLGHVRSNPDPNVRYVAYSKLASKDAYGTDAERAEAVTTLIEKYEKGNEPLAIRAIICRTLGELGDPRARDVLLKAVHHQEPVVKIEACRALGKVGRPEDATVLAQTMTLDNLEDARIAAIEGLADLKSRDPRIYKVLLDSMEHDDPAIRLASLNALRKITGKDLGTEIADWRRDLEPIMAATPSDMAAPATMTSAADEAAAKTTAAKTAAPRR
ncbi:HEAT repeat domain-containing protein [Paludisphaera mucosa]|uniref:HEAT repeat domain-containing protein n=1 Tax=Paludisphaera mucosa TaxID=3030827 RepID=A0ABT6FFT0_9BACT|nr:HEAT repeat domain-containing protein [Paludisphaera mucosa]MDG3006253.1 HEAT repeat domain-containing protein [Paludisphaera mucosa]